MKKLVIAAMLASIACSVSAGETIRFASSATNPPFESLDENNQFVGYDIDLVNAMCAQMKATCTFTNQAFDSIIPALKFKRYDAAISSMDITPERSKQVAFTKPYIENSAILIAYKNTFKNIDELKGKRVGMQNGTTHQKYLQDRYPEIQVVPYDSYQNAILDLKNKRLDAVFGDTAVVNEWLKENPVLDVVGERITDAKYFGTGMGIAVRLDNHALVDKLNASLDAIKADGTYQKINDKWFPK